MKSFKFAAPLVALLASVTAAHGQSYGGVGLGYSRIGVACGQSIECSSKRLGGVVYAGVAAPESLALDMGFAKVSAIEMGLMSFGTKSSTSETFTTTRSGTRVTTTRTEQRSFMDANGFFAAMAANGSFLTDELVLTGRAGVAYITSTVARRTNGVSVGSETSNRAAPYLGLGAEYKLGGGLSVVLRLDASKFGAGGRSGSLLLGSYGMSYEY